MESKSLPSAHKDCPTFPLHPLLRSLLDFIDKELSQFIATKRLNCKIDKVVGIVSTTRVDQKNTQYNQVVKSGDALLNQVQKLSQIVNI
jgi:26S proteasome regulatory subunit N7